MNLAERSGRGDHVGGPQLESSSGPRTPARRNVALVGMMGAGKTAVGELLAARLGWTFYDTDVVLEATFGEPIARIFESPGEAVFRRAEELLVKALRNVEGAVLATGGGLWVSPANRRSLATFAYTAYLAAPPPVLWQRLQVAGTASRPLLEGRGRAALERLHSERDPIYRLADWTLDSADLSPQAIVQQLIRRVKAARLIAPAGAAA